MMTAKERNTIRERIAQSIIKVNDVKQTLKSVIEEFDLPHITSTNEEKDFTYYHELEAIDQSWNGVLELWDSIEEAMQYDVTTYDQLNEALVEHLPNLFHDLRLIEKSINYKSSSSSHYQ